MVFAVPALAQTQSEGSGETRDREEDIVVTGTLIRGIAPIGSNEVAISRDDISLSGTTDTNQLLATVPQSNSFLELPVPGDLRTAVTIQQGASRIPVNAPNLRLFFVTPGVDSGPITLVLMDGHRIVPTGLEQSVVDAAIVPPGILERVETILDGASAVYGSDAVGGVINYIPRKRFSGTEASATYGFADDYYAVSADLTTGASWDTGGFAVSYSFGRSSNILKRERDHQIPRNYLEGGHLTGLACEDHSHVTVGAGASARTFVTYAGQTTFAERTDYCALGYETYVPSIERHGAFGVVSQEISDALRFEMTAFYSWRQLRQNSGPELATVQVTPTNPYYRQIPGTAPGVTQTVRFNYGPVLGFDYGLSESVIEVWQLTPSLTFDVSDKWQVRSNFAYGKSNAIIDQRRRNTALEGTYIRGNTLIPGTNRPAAINPYDIAATQDLALIDNLRTRNFRRGTHEMLSARVIADGPLMTLPGGEVRLAVGAEYSKINFERLDPIANTTQFLPLQRSSTVNKALFGELSVPVVGTENSMPGIDSLTLSASARFDDYREFGSTFNPKFAATYNPVDWITIRGNWGKSFRAPNVVDKLGVAGTTVRCIGSNIPGCVNFPISASQTPPGFTINPATDIYLTAGGTQEGLGPEKSTNWAIGADVRPPFVPGLTLSATYFAIDFKDKIAGPGALFQPIFAFGPELYTLNPTPAQIAAFAALSPTTGPALLQTLQNLGSSANVRFLIDTRVRNLAQSKVRGIDFSARYIHPTDWGSINASAAGTIALKNDIRVFKNQPFEDEIDFGVERAHLTFSLGATYGNLTGNAVLQHRSGYKIDPVNFVNFANQTRIDAFDVVNLNFRWNLSGSNFATKDLALTFIVNNVFDTDPPISRDVDGGTQNGDTIGRYFQFGITKKF